MPEATLVLPTSTEPPAARARPRSRIHGADLLAAASLLALVAATYGPLAVSRPLSGYDITTYSLPYRAQVTNALRHLHLPLWDPARLAGVPLLANPQAAALYPPHWLLLALPPDRAVSVSLVLHAAIAAVGVYALGTRALHTSRLAAALAAGTFVLSGFFHAHLGHLEQETTMAWLPWALLAADRCAAAPRLSDAATPAAGLAATVALTALAGHSQYLYMAVASVLVYAVLVSRPLRRAGRVAVGAALGVALAGPQLVPTALLSGRSLRGGGLAFSAAAEYSLPLARAESTFLPRFGHQPPLPVEYWAWLPCAVLVLAGLALVSGRWTRHRSALVVLASGGLLLALGSHTPAFRLAYDVVPGLDSFRVPARWLLLPTLAVPLLAASGLDALLSGARARRRPLLLLLAAAGGALVAVALSDARPPAGSLALDAAAAGVAATAWAVTRRRPSWRAGAGLLVAAVVLVDLVAADRPTDAHRQRMEPGSMLARSVTARSLDDPAGGRVLALGGEPLFDFAADRRDLRPNTHVLDGLRSVDGYDGGLMYTRAWASAMARLVGHPDFVATNTLRANIAGPLDPTLFEELDTTRVVAHGAGDLSGVLPPQSALIRQVGDISIWRTPAFGPVFVEGGEVPAGLVLHRDPHRPERLVVDVPAVAGGRRVVVSEAAAPGWSAGPVRLAVYDGLLMSFRAPPSGGRVVLHYRQPGLRGGAVLSALAMAVIAGALALARRSLRKPLP